MTGRCLSGSVGITVPQLYGFLADAVIRYDANAALAGAGLGLPTMSRGDVAAALKAAWNVTPAIACFDGWVQLCRLECGQVGWLVVGLWLRNRLTEHLAAPCRIWGP